MELSFGGIVFSSKFDSGNLASVEQVDGKQENVQGDNVDPVDFEFKLWTMPDAAGTPYENGNRTWFYFSVRGPLMSKSVRFNIMNLNRQSRLYKQGFAPFYKTTCSKNSSWHRIKDKVTFENEADGNFKISFTHRFTEITKLSTTYFAYCYPYSYGECQQYLCGLVEKYPLPDKETNFKDDDIYFHRDTLVRSNDGLIVDLLTVSSMKGKTNNTEENLLGLFPNKEQQRANIFLNKKIIFLTSRVHPGETPASFAFQGFVDFILRSDDCRAAILREKFVFKLVPMLNPDGVKRGYYRTDVYGVNLNRTYQNPDLFQQPSIFAIKTIMMYHHFNRTDPRLGANKSLRASVSFMHPQTNIKEDCIRKAKTEPCLPESCVSSTESSCEAINDAEEVKEIANEKYTLKSDVIQNDTSSSECVKNASKRVTSPEESGAHSSDIEDDIFVYIDLHGHASKRGCFIYGNNFLKEKDMVECMLLPKLISLNSSHFDFQACNFTKKNMYHKDKKDGLSKEGSGRVSMFKELDIIHCYTLECNYNTGRATNVISNATCDNGRATPPPLPGFPPRYTPEHFEEVGRGTAIAILDLCNCNPWTRLPTSEYKSLNGVRDWLTKFSRNSTPKCSIVKNVIKQKPIGSKSIISHCLANKTSKNAPSSCMSISPSKTCINDGASFKTSLLSTPSSVPTTEKRKDSAALRRFSYRTTTTKNKDTNNNDKLKDSPTKSPTNDAPKLRGVSSFKPLIGDKPSQRNTKKNLQKTNKTPPPPPIITPATDLKQVLPDIHIIAKEVATRLKLEEQQTTKTGGVNTPNKRTKRSPVSGKSSQRKVKSSISSSPISSMKKNVVPKNSKTAPDVNSTEYSFKLTKASRRRKSIDTK